MVDLKNSASAHSEKQVPLLGYNIDSLDLAPRWLVFVFESGNLLTLTHFEPVEKVKIKTTELLKGLTTDDTKYTCESVKMFINK